MFRWQDMTQSPPTQELVAKDLHGMEWRFRHIFRGNLGSSHLPWFVPVVYAMGLIDLLHRYFRLSV